MRRLLIKSTLLILIPVIVVSFLMLSMSDNGSKYSHEVNFALAYQRLDSLQGKKKIVIIAGSNGGFSINSQILHDSLKLPVINTSTHAGIGVRMQFEMYKDLLEKGDIVIFCPEYYSDKKRLYGESTLFRIMSTHMPEAYLKMNFMQWYNTFRYVGIHCQKSIEHVNNQPFDGAYSERSVNCFGDISFPREHHEIKDEYHFKGNMDKETTAYYQYIHEFSKGKGINLIYLPPTLIESNYISQKSQIDSLVSFMQDNNIPFRATPKRYVFNDSLFFDSPYHMTTQGAIIRTKNLVEDIKSVIQKIYWCPIKLSTKS